MAEVYGNIGDQPIELNNAATEATLQSLLEVANAQFKSQTKGKDLKAQKDLEKKLKDLANAAKNSAATMKQSAVANKESIRVIREKTEEERKSIVTKEKFNAKVKAATGHLLNLTNSVASMGNSITSAASAISSLAKEIPVIGGVIGSSLDMIAGSIEKTHQSFMQASIVGANFGASIEVMINSASAAGLTIDQFTSIVSSNGEAMALLGTSSADGAKRFAQLGKAMRQSNVQDQLANLGYNTEGINESMAKYIDLIGKSGRLQGINDRQLIELTGDYLKELDAVSKLTGQSKKDIEAETAARMRDAQVRITMSKLSAEDQKQLHTLMNLIPEEHRKGFKDIVATGSATTEEAKKVFSFLPGLARNAQSLNQQVMRSGKIAADASEQIYDQYQKEASGLANSDLGNLLAAYTQDAGTFMVAALDVAAREGKTLNQVLAEVEKAAGKTSKRLGEMSPAELVKAQQGLAVSSNELNKELLKFSTAFFDLLGGFNKILQTTLIPIIGGVADKFNELYKSFKDDGIGGVASTIAGMIYDKGVAIVKFLIDKAQDIGSRIATGFVRNLPNWLKKAFGIEDKTVEELQLEELENRLKTTSDPVTKEEIKKELAQVKTKVESPQEKKLTAKINEVLSYYQLAENTGTLTDEDKIRYDRELDSLSKQLADATQLRKGTPTEPNVPSKATIDTNGGVSQEPETPTHTINGLTNSLEAQADATAEWAKSGQEQWAADDKRRKEQAEQDRKDREATEDLTKATKDLAKETKASSSCELDYSSPQALFNSFAKIMVGGKPGVSDSMTGASAAATPQQLASITDALSLTGGAGRISSTYGMRDLGPAYGGMRMHKGVDIAAAEGTDVRAPEAGTVRLKTEIDKATGKMKGYGKYIEILNEQGEVIHRLAHLSEFIVKEGERVAAGQAIGKVGNTGASTGAHLHWEYLKGGKQVNPQMFLDAQQAQATPQGTAVTPTSSQAAAAVVREPAAGGTTPNTPGAGAAGAGNTAPANTMSSQLETLNTTAGQLVALTSESNNIARQQLSAIKNSSSDLYT
jgi:murein DD-endopeptidase MepM/ murein hydrolase activator NlpD